MRLFVAIRLPPPVRRLLAARMGGIGGARWQDEEQLHLTLRFIGEVDRHGARDVHAALGAVHHPPFTIALDGFGTFERRGRIETIWAGVTPHAPLGTLHNKIDRAVARAGIAPDRRAFMPHVTLARLGRAAGDPRAFLKQAGGLSSPLFTVDGFALHESVLTPGGAIHSVLERYALG